MSEKMDGIRAYWDGSKLLTRQGHEILLPHPFTRGFPSIPLDGELWMGPGTYEKMAGLLRSHSGDWTGVKYVLFDMPGSTKFYGDRLKEMRGLSLPWNAMVVDSQRCEGIQHMREMMDRIVKLGGEGIMAT